MRGLSNAWHSRGGVSDELVDAYRLPQLVRGWEIGLVRFVRARVAGVYRLSYMTDFVHVGLTASWGAISFWVYVYELGMGLCNRQSCDSWV